MKFILKAKPYSFCWTRKQRWTVYFDTDYNRRELFESLHILSEREIKIRF